MYRSDGGTDWGRFGFDAARHDAAPGGDGHHRGERVQARPAAGSLDGTVDSSPIYLHGVKVDGDVHDVFFVTTTYGKTEAIDAASGKVLWRFTPPTLLDRSPARRRSRTQRPVASTDADARSMRRRRTGEIRKLRVSDGKVLWATR